MDYQIALNFTDGVTRIIDCGARETVLDAAYRNRINLPMDCSDGVCGTCRCHCEDGRYDQGEEYLDEALSEEDAVTGHVLTCQMVPHSDCVLNVPVAAKDCKLNMSAHVGIINQVDSISSSTTILKIETKSDLPIKFLAGQYVNLAIPGTDQSRSYSMSSAPGNKTMSFLIRNIPGGLMSRWLTTDAKPGMAMEFAGPKGIFFLREQVRPITFLAGGTGLAPILSMLDVLADGKCDLPVRLLYGVNVLPDLAELERLKLLKKTLHDFSFETIISDSESGHDKIGYVTNHMTAEHIRGGDVDIYVCGPPPMVEAVRTYLNDQNVTPENLYFEKFLPTKRGSV